MSEWSSLPLDGLSEWQAGNYGDVPVDAGAVATLPRPHFSPEVEKYRAQAEQDLGNPADVDAYLKSLEGGNTPAPNERERQRRLRIQSQQEADTQAVLAQEATNRPAPVKSLINESGGVEGNYGPFDARQGSDYVDAPTGSLRAQLEAQRQGKDQLSNAALAGAVALPIIGAGPIAGPLGVVGGEVGQSVDEKLGLPRVKVPVLGEVGPATLAGGLLGGVGESVLAPTALRTTANEGLTTAAGNTARNVVRPPRLRLVQPGETPGGLSIIGRNQADPQAFLDKARGMGLSDDQIREAFPGVIEAAAGIDIGVQQRARIDLEQTAKAAAARRTYTRVFQEYKDAALKEGYSDSEAEQIATGLASKDARNAAGAAPEALPAQRPNVPYSEEAAAQMAEASRRLRSVVEDTGPLTEANAPKVYDALSAEADRLEAAGHTSPPPSLISDLSWVASQLGDPFNQLVLPRVLKEGGQLLKQAVKDAENQQQDENKGALARTIESAQNPQKPLGLGGPEQPVPPEQLNMLSDVLGQQSFQSAEPTGGPLTSAGQTQYPKFDAASVAERARLSEQYAKNFGGPQMSETEFRQQWQNVKVARDGGRRWPENWTQDKIHQFQKLEQGLSEPAGFPGEGAAVEGAVAKGAEVPQASLPGVGPTSVRKPTNFAQDVYNEVSGIAGKALSLKSSLSPPLLRQGLSRLLTNPRQAFKEFGLSVKAGISEDAAREIDDASFRQRWISPYSKEGVSPYKGYTWDELGGARWDWGENAAERAPGYEGRGVSKIVKKAGDVAGQAQESVFGKNRKLGTGEGVSERQAAVQQNLNARGRYQETAQRMWDFEDAHGLPHDKAMYQDLVKTIEHAQQRGGVGQRGVPLLFSARAMSGRVQAALDSTVGILRNPQGLLRPGATQEAGKNLLAFMALNYSLAQLASELGAEVNFNPLPSVRIGEHHYDMWGGMKPIATFGLDIGKIFEHTVKTGDVDKGLSDALLRSKDFLRAGTSPLTNTLISAAERKDFIGKPYSLTDNIKSGELFKEMGLNFVAESLWDGFKADGVKGAAMDAPFAVLSGGVNTYSATRDVRNDTAQNLYGKQYDELSPDLQGIVNRTEQVQKARLENPTPYDEAKAAGEQSIPIQEARRAEQSFKNNTPLAKALPEYWADENVARLQMSTDLQKQFADQFADFDKTKYDKAVQGYYDTDVKDANGNRDFEATDVARQKYVAGLPADQQEWINQALQVARENKTPEHQSYLNYLDQKQAKGYFAKDVSASGRNALDRANPALDVQQWYWRGNVQSEPGGAAKPGPALNSLEGVKQALALDPNRPVTYQNVPRAINKDAKSLEYWNKTGARVDFYVQGGDSAIQKAAMEYLAGNEKDWKTLSSDEQLSRAKTLVRDTLVKDPAYDAALIWWGVRDKIPSQEVYDALVGIVNNYGPMYKKTK